MNRPTIAILSLTLLAVSLAAPAAEGDTLAGAKVALHLTPYNAKSVCIPESQGGQAPDLTPCSQYATAGLTETGYHAYLTVAAPGPLTDHPGVGGLSCGILYQGGTIGGDTQIDGVGVDVYGWYLCASGGEFRGTPTGLPEDLWPASGGGNMITFDAVAECPLTAVPGYESEGVVAVFGVFYVYAYSPDVLQITPNLPAAESELEIVDCWASPTHLPTSSAGAIGFSADGSDPGINPCECLATGKVDFGSVWIGDSLDLPITVRNLGSDIINGTVPASCDEFQIVSGSGPFSLLPGDSLTATVRYEGVTEGRKTCDLFLGTPCSSVRLTVFTPPPFRVSPTQIELGSVALGDTALGVFTVRSIQVADLEFELSLSCPDFTILEGTGPFSLASAEEMAFTIQYTPTVIGPNSCVISTGSLATPVTVSAIAVSLPAVCSLSPTNLDFGSVTVGLETVRSFGITNEGSATLTGTVSEDCPDFSIVSGAGAFSLAAGLTHTVQVRFAPTSIGAQSCIIDVSGGCANLPVSGTGIEDVPGGQSQAVIALHATARSPQGECDNAPTIPCSDYTVEWPEFVGCDLWLVVARGNEPGIAGLSCGIEYGSNITMFDWTFCASGLQFPTDGGNGEWPASLSGNRMTWDPSVDCQTTVLGGDGIHAVAGSFYVYAYAADLFEITLHELCCSSPELQVLNCDNEAFDIPVSSAAGACGFGGVIGYNPCGGEVPRCNLSATALDFGLVDIGEFEDQSLVITNEGDDTLTGTVSEDCEYFSIWGGASFALASGESHTLTVRFAPRTTGAQTCTVSVSGICADVVITGEGVAPSWPGQGAPVVALHASPHMFKVNDPCPAAPQIPCSEYTTQWPLNEVCDLYLVVAHGDPPGIAAVSCGIMYDNGATGGATRENGIGVDVYEWTFCASGLQFPTGCCDLGAEWPASGGGNRMTWDASVDCQTTVLGGDGIHAVAGSFYVYAYSPDLFEIVINDIYSSSPDPSEILTDHLHGGPEFQVGDCDYNLVDLPYPEAAGAVGFGEVAGYNPCAGPVSVRLLSFTAARVHDGAEVRWVVAGADYDHLGFEVYRGLTEDDRVRVSGNLLSGRESYVFVDDDPPSTTVNYWLAERSRTGDVSWHGPVELAAASGPAPGFVLGRAAPNPFLSATHIAFRTGVDGPVEVRVYDTAGREVARPFIGDLPAGDHEVAWDGRSSAGERLSAGIYFYRVETARGGGAGKVVLIR